MRVIHILKYHIQNLNSMFLQFLSSLLFIPLYHSARCPVHWAANHLFFFLHFLLLSFFSTFPLTSCCRSRWFFPLQSFKARKTESWGQQCMQDTHNHPPCTLLPSLTASLRLLLCIMNKRYMIMTEGVLFHCWPLSNLLLLLHFGHSESAALKVQLTWIWFCALFFLFFSKTFNFLVKCLIYKCTI